MANYNLVIDTQFQPFSYQEMLHPVQEATKAHQQIEEAYSTISLEAAQWEKLANEAGSETAYQTYKDYANNLREQADMLAREGLTPMSRQNLSKARTAYIEKIDPIKQAYDRRMQIRDLQEKGRMQDGDIMYEMEAGDIGLDNLIANPNYTPRAYSGKQIYQDTAQMASNLTKRILDDPDQDKWKSILGGQYYELKYGRGLSPAQVLATLQGSPEGSAELYTIMNDVISATGIQNWDNQAALEKAWDYARKGAWSAIGQDDSKQVSNKAYDYAMQQQMEIARENRARRAAGELDDPKGGIDNTETIMRFSDSDQAKSKLDALQNLRDKINQNGYSNLDLNDVYSDNHLIYSQINSISKNVSKLLRLTNPQNEAQLKQNVKKDLKPYVKSKVVERDGKRYRQSYVDVEAYVMDTFKQENNRDPYLLDRDTYSSMVDMQKNGELYSSIEDIEQHINKSVNFRTTYGNILKGDDKELLTGIFSSINRNNGKITTVDDKGNFTKPIKNSNFFDVDMDKNGNKVITMPEAPVQVTLSLDNEYPGLVIRYQDGSNNIGYIDNKYLPEALQTFINRASQNIAKLHRENTSSDVINNEIKEYSGQLLLRLNNSTKVKATNIESM